MPEIYKAARRFSGMDWDKWPDATILPSGTRPVILEVGGTSVVLYGSEKRGDSTVVVALGKSSEEFPLYRSIVRTVDENKVGTVEQIEEEQIELFNEVAKALETGKKPEDVADYYGL